MKNILGLCLFTLSGLALILMSFNCDWFINYTPNDWSKLASQNSGATPTASSTSSSTATPSSTSTPTWTPTPTQTYTATPTVSSTDPPLSTWGYKIPITITEHSGATLTDYQVLVTLTNANFSYSHLQNINGNDIRFYSNGTACSYYIQTWNNGGSSLIWVKLPVLNSGTDTTADLYYGCTVTPAPKSNGDATFLLFDDFNDNFFDTYKWTDGSLNGAYVSESGQNMLLLNNNDTPPKSRGYLISKNTFEKNISVDCCMKIAGTNKAFFDGFIQTDGVHTSGTNYDFPNNCYNFEYTTASTQKLKLNKMVSGTSNWDIQPQIPITGDTNWHTVSMQYFNQQIMVYLDNTQEFNFTDTTDFTTRYIAFATRESGSWSQGTRVSLDWVFVRKIAMPEPSVALGTEEQMY